MSELSGRKAASHERIVEAAARAVRRQGYHGVNVTEVMREAGLTHGGFYAHFPSRDALLAQAVTQAGVDNAALLRDRMGRGKAGKSPLHALVETYLSMEHVRDRDTACPVSLLASEMFRQAPEVAAASRDAVVNLHRLVKEALPGGAAADAAWEVTSAMLGAVQIARALGEGAAARTVLAQTRSNLLARYDT